MDVGNPTAAIYASDSRHMIADPDGGGADLASTDGSSHNSIIASGKDGTDPSDICVYAVLGVAKSRRVPLNHACQQIWLPDVLGTSHSLEQRKQMLFFIGSFVFYSTFTGPLI